MIKEALEDYVKALKGLEEFHRNPPAGVTASAVRDFKAPVHMHEFVLKYGEVWRGQVLPSKYRLRQIKQCFKNTYNLTLRSKALTYVEGFVASNELPLALHHAWAVNKKGEVIDTTLRAWKDLNASGGDRAGITWASGSRNGSFEANSCPEAHHEPV